MSKKREAIIFFFVSVALFLLGALLKLNKNEIRVFFFKENKTLKASTSFSQSEEGYELLATIENWRTLDTPTLSERVQFLNLLSQFAQREPVEYFNRLYASGLSHVVTPNQLIDYLINLDDGNSHRQWMMTRAIADSKIREEATEAVVRRQCESDAMAAFRLYSEYAVDYSVRRESLRQEILAAIAKGMNHERLMAFKQSVFGTNKNVSELVLLWAKDDISAALDFLKSDAGDSLNRVNILDNIVKRTGPKAVSSYVKTFPPSAFRSKIIEATLAQELLMRPGSWQEINGALSSEISKTNVFAQAALQSMKNNPQKANEFLNLINSDRERQSVARQATSSLLRDEGREPKFVFDWARTVNDPSIRAGIVKELRSRGIKLPEFLKPNN